ncbi:hypothetical protein COLO4_34835 [Corchorus olitorius]|uniref:Uncharacterized protein n=1 Tax=Corchorus olitorius TaxID=93759 RepID=A0A1R3GJC2_9ROSI|nr:hypothetical protein COLO4_34835 [Corchorus olitorius]
MAKPKFHFSPEFNHSSPIKSKEYNKYSKQAEIYLFPFAACLKLIGQDAYHPM